MLTTWYGARIPNLHLENWWAKNFSKSIYQRILPDRIKLPIILQELEFYEDGRVEMPKYTKVYKAVGIGFAVGVFIGSFLKCFVWV